MPPCRHTSVAPSSQRLAAALGDVVERQQVRRAAQVERQRALGEPAEPALERADVGVVDVAVADVGDRRRRRPRWRSSSASAATAATSGPRAANRVTISSSPTSWPARTPASTSATAPPAPGRVAGDEAWAARRRRRSTRPWSGGRRARPRRRCRRRASPGCRSGNTAPGSSRPSPSASARSTTGKRSAGSSQRSGVARRTRGRSVSRGASAKPARLGDLAQPVERRPGPLGVDVVGGDRRDAAPVVDAGVEQHAEVVGQVGRRLEVDVRRQDQPGQRRWPRGSSSGGHGGACVHGGARLGQEVLDDHLLHVAVARVRGGDRLQRREPVGAVLADADEDPGGERDRRARPAASSVASRRSGVLSGAPRWAARSASERLDHHPLARRRPAAAAASSSADRAPGVGVRQQPGLVEHEPAHGREVVDGRGVAVLGEPVARRRGSASSGRSPRVNSASWQPGRAPRPGRCASTSSGER